ncbi:MAG: flagellar biosynthesis protein FlhF [Phycisphaerae bacterium]
MNLKTYQAQTMAQALAHVRRDLGKEAVILNTRTVKKGGFLGLGTKNIVEVTATSGVNVLHPDQRKSFMEKRRDREGAGITEKSPPPQVDHLQQELVLVKQMVQELLYQNKRQQHPAVPQELFAAYLCLINQQVAEGLAGEVIDEVKSILSADQLKDAKKVRSVLTRSIEKMLPPAQPITLSKSGKTKTIALVGPTGVGKTTTIAKLAANFKLRDKKSVGLITIDTYRIAAVDQLRTYADIINVPLRVVLTPDELRDAVKSMSNLDLVLIDTAGRSQNDDLKLRELKSFLHAAKPDEIHLVLSTTASQANLQAAVQRFQSLNIDRIIFTKLDEAVGLGILLNIIKKLDRAVSYITTGQNVPDDIEPAAAEKLAQLLLHHQNWPDASQLTADDFSMGVALK